MLTTPPAAEQKYVIAAALSKFGLVNDIFSRGFVEVSKLNLKLNFMINLYENGF